MFQTGDIIKSIIQIKKEDRNVYLNCMDRNLHKSSLESQAQFITDLLFKSKTRSIALSFLIKYVNQYSDLILKEKVNTWLTIITRMCNIKEVRLYGDLIYEVLAMLVIKIQTIPETAKWFGVTCIGKIYESLLFIDINSNIRCTISSLNAVRQCLKYYPGPSKSGKPIVMKYLLQLLDSSCPEIVYHSGNCWLLLQQVRGNINNVAGSNDRNQWNDFQLGLLGSLDDLLYEAISNHEDYRKDSRNHKFEFFCLEIHGDPIERAARICRRFSNLIDFLKIALSQPYPSPKLICPKKILNLIQRGLAVNYGNCILYESMCIENLFPHIHNKLLELLEVLINVCHTHLRRHLRLISSIVMGSLQKTILATPEGFTIELINCRIMTYKVVMSWVTTFSEGSGCDLIADRLVNIILKDIAIRRRAISLKSTSQSKTALKKKKEESTYAMSEKELNNENNCTLCKEALDCLQCILYSVGSLLNPQVIKDIFTSLLEICLLIYEKRIWEESNYSNLECRLKLYKTLCTFLHLRNISSLLGVILYVLDESIRNDPSSEIRLSCKAQIVKAERILHSQRESLMLISNTQCGTSLLEKNQYEIHNDRNQSFSNKTELEIQKKINNSQIIDDCDKELNSCKSESKYLQIEKNEENSRAIRNDKYSQLNFSSISKINTTEAHIERKELFEITMDSPQTEKECLKIVNIDSREKLVSNNLKSDNSDEEYVAELEAAFVDEWK